MTQKLTIIGSGTAGCLSLIHFLKNTNYEIDWVCDELIKPQAVGEGSILDLPIILTRCVDFQHDDLEKIDGTFKIGVFKKNWNGTGNFMHYFPPPMVAYHFNAIRLQNYIKNCVKDNTRIKKINSNISSHDELDGDFIMDCSGNPTNYDDYTQSTCIPVNSVYVTQCYWDMPRFNYTLAIARPYGWVFGIPLTNRCSIGYMYNKDINTLEEVKEDVKQIFEDYNLTPSEDTNSFSFKNYYRKNNIVDRVVYNGNASFFLEPLEATSIACMHMILRRASKYFSDPRTCNEHNNAYTTNLIGIENILALHYFAGSKYDTPFWAYAERIAREQLTIGLKCPTFQKFLTQTVYDYQHYSEMWPSFSFKQNLNGFKLHNKLDNLFKEIHGYSLFNIS
jgi:hypothetical protein